MPADKISRHFSYPEYLPNLQYNFVFSRKFATIYLRVSSNYESWCIVPSTKKQFLTFTCWLFGHDVGGSWVPQSYRRANGELCGSWIYHCNRCSTKHEFPDRRNLYRRTVVIWLFQLENRWKFRNVQRDFDRGREAYLAYLAEQLKIYAPEEKVEK